MNIREAAKNFLDDYESLCIKHRVMMIGDSEETDFSKGLKFSSISMKGKIRIETEEFKVSDVIDGLREKFR